MLFALKRKVRDGLVARGVDANVTYEPPRVASDLQTWAGVLDAIWFDDSATMTFDAELLSGGYSAVNPVRVDETARVTVVVQSLRPTGTQEDVDERAAELLRDVIAVLVTAPMLVETGELQSFHVLPVSATVATGFLGTSDGHGCRIELDVEAFSRLTIT